MKKRILRIGQLAICVFLGLSGTFQAFGESFVIPHFVDGIFETRALVERRFVLNLLIFNPSNQELPVTLEAFDDQGEAREFSLDGPPSIPPMALARYRLSFAQLVSAWLRITTAGPAVVRASIQFREFDNFDPPPPTGFPVRVLTETDADPAPARLHGIVPVLFDGLGRTGVALAFPTSGSEDATATLTLRGGDGQQLGAEEITVPPNGRSVFVVEDMFPAFSQAGEVGTLEFSSDGPLAGTAIRFQSDPVYLHTVVFGDPSGN